MRKYKIILLTLDLVWFMVCALSCFAEKQTGIVAKVTTEKGPLKLRSKPDDDGRVLDEIPNGKNCHVSKADRHDTRLCRASGASGLSVL